MNDLPEQELSEQRKANLYGLDGDIEIQQAKRVNFGKGSYIWTALGIWMVFRCIGGIMAALGPMSVVVCTLAGMLALLSLWLGWLSYREVTLPFFSWPRPLALSVVLTRPGLLVLSYGLTWLAVLFAFTGV